MKSVTVNASGSYEIHIGAGALELLPEKLSELPRVQKICLVSDSNVFPLWGKETEALLSSYEVCSFVFPAGEQSKCGETYLSLLNFLAEHQLTRSDCLIALGGGVAGDLTGFAAATYLRGIPLIQIPTSLLAMVDSSVGGKTAIDLPAGKNLAGAFYQPRLVLCDLNLLSTLPEEIFLDGCAEVIKYGILYDPRLFGHLEALGPDFHREQVITRCVELKRDVVEQDEFDLGLRMKLNLGHTIGHGVEAGSGFTLSHGKSVAIGTAIVTRSAAAQGLCSRETENRILSVLQKFNLPIHTEFTAEELMIHALSDKKRSGNTVSLIVPREIGCCDIVPTEISRILSFIKAGLSYGPYHPSPETAG